MNPWIQLQKATPQFLITLLIVCLGSSPKSGAVTPAPDGGYPGGNTAEGEKALLRLSSGGYNTAIGWLSIESSMTGTANTGVGAGTLALNTADGNTAAGAGALLFNKVAIHNTAAGAFALFNNNSTGNAQPNGCWNSAFGEEALFNNTDGAQNAAFGESAMHENTTGNFNTGIGDNALRLNQTGSANTAVGYFALNHNTGGPNTAVGSAALFNNTNAGNSVAFGDGALNAFVSATATDGGNTALGSIALSSETAGQENVAVGRRALQGLLTGSNNTAVGWRAGANYIGNESNNVAIGTNVGSPTDSNSIRINDAVSPAPFTAVYCAIGGIANSQFVNNEPVVEVNPLTNQLGISPSSARFKKDINPMDKASEQIFALKPVTFHYKNDPKETSQFGLVAEDVVKVNPDLVVRDREGKPYTVCYQPVNLMLLNEFLKEHKTVQQQGTTIAEQQKEIKALKTELKEQRALIQKVSDKVELNNPAPTVVNNQ